MPELYVDSFRGNSALSNPFLVVAIPAYNEERFIGSVVIQALCQTPTVVVIDDGSSDRTAYIAEKAGAIVIQHPQNMGKAAAVNTAIEWARRQQVQVLVFLDGDGQHRPNEIGQIAAPVIKGQADLVVGSRFLQIKSKIPNYRIIGQHALTIATNFASNISVSDSQSGFRALSKKAIELMHFNSNGLSIESEMQFLAKEHNLRICEVAISVIYQERAKRNSFIHGMQIVANIAKLIGQHRPLFFFGLPGMFLLLSGLLIGLLTLRAYSETHLLAINYALPSLGLTIVGVLAIFVGLILHSIRAFFLDLKKTLQNNPASQSSRAMPGDTIL